VRLDTPATRAYNAGKELMRPSGPGPVVYGGDSMSQQTVDLFKFVALRSPDEPQASALSLGYIRDDRVDLVDRHPLPDVTPDREDFGGARPTELVLMRGMPPTTSCSGRKDRHEDFTLLATGDRGTHCRPHHGRDRRRYCHVTDWFARHPQRCGHDFQAPQQGGYLSEDPTWRHHDGRPSVQRARSEGRPVRRQRSVD